MNLFRNKTNTFFIYYSFLLLIFISWQNYESVPSAIFRIAYLAAIVFPLYVSKIEFYPSIITIFYTIAMFGFTTSYMPAQYYTYIAVTAGAVVVASRRKNHQILPLYILLLFIFILLVNTAYDDSWQYVSSALLILIMFYFIVDRNYEEQSYYFTYSFIISSFILAIYYIIIGPKFILDYLAKEGIERIGFSDINYGASVVGMGIFAAFVELIRNRNMSLLRKILIYSTIGLSSIALVMNASRGAVLSVCTAVAILLYFTKIKTGYKILAILALSFFIAFLYSYGFVDLLIYRIQNDEIGGGTGRLDIWQTKILSFLNDVDPIQWLVGLGYSGGRHLGYGSDQWAFHNDFLAFLVEYGIIGFTLFIKFLFTPFQKSGRIKPMVLAGMSFLLLTCMTLEPFAAGRFPFFVFWFYMVQLSKSNWSFYSRQ